MSRQAGVIGRNRAERLESHVTEVFLLFAGSISRARSQAKPIAIGRKSNCALGFFHAELCEIVPMKFMAILGLTRQCSAHSLLCCPGEGPTEMLINSSNHCDRIAANVDIVDVANAMLCQ